MTRITAIGLLFVLLLHLVGFYIYFVIQMWEVHEKMRNELATLPADQLTVLRLSRFQVRESWLEEREVEWQGKMYDIARVEVDGDTVNILCVHDVAEDNLIVFLDNILTESSRENSEAPPQLLSFLDLEFTLSDCKASIYFGIKQKTFSFIYTESPYDFVLGVEAPPPWA